MIHKLQQQSFSWMTSWPVWACLVNGMVLWVLPRLPYYEEGLPYLYFLGGPALVAWYIGLGCLSLGLYCILDGWRGYRSRITNIRSAQTGGGALFLAGMLSLLYWFLVDVSAALP